MSSSEPTQAGDKVSQSNRNRHRRLRSYYIAGYSDLREAIHNVSQQLTFIDAETILSTLAEHLNDYSGPDVRGQEPFTRWARTWVQHFAKLILAVRELEPALIEAAQKAVPSLTASEYNTVVRRVEHCVNELLQKDTANLLQWATTWAVAESRGLEQWQQWISCPIVRRCILAGLWSVLSQCADLGLGKTDDKSGRNSIVEELAGDVYIWAWENSAALANGDTPIGARLKARARFHAQEWKTNQLRDKERFLPMDEIDRPKQPNKLKLKKTERNSPNSLSSPICAKARTGRDDDDVSDDEREGNGNLLSLLEEFARFDAIPIETDEEIPA